MDRFSVSEIREQVRRHPLLAILRNVPLEMTADYVEAIIGGGISFFEVALNSEHGLEQLRLLRERFGGRAIIGAGTAVTVEKAQAALEAGAQFLLAPSPPEKVLRFCAERDVAFLPGVMTPGDVQLCLDYGFSTLKLFPAGELPRSYVRSLKGPFDGTEYVAIGGVTPRNVCEFFDAGCIGAGFGANLMPRDLMEQRDWRSCSEHIAEIVAKVQARRKRK